MYCTVHDPASSSNSQSAIILHLDITWKVCFPERKLTGRVVIKVHILKDLNIIVLDGKSLNIQSVSCDGVSLNYNIVDAGFRGQKITIFIGKRKQGEMFCLVIDYETGEKCSALQFLTREQTSDKKGPFLFSYCKTIHARSIVPCMDTPSVKQSYSAEVEVPKGLVCLMSALNTGTQEKEDSIVYTFQQDLRIPSYLLAIVVGVLQKRDISPRCAVWSERSVVQAAYNKFERVEFLLKTAEKLLGDYVWGRCDVVVLPSTFPYGAMENPGLTFVNSTCITGDTLLTNLIIHEIAYSWAGNLVTNATWEHLWLNEGLTVYVERIIIREIEDEKARNLAFLVGWEDRFIPVIEQFSEYSKFTQLVQDHTNIDPEDVFSAISSEKAFAFLYFLETHLCTTDDLIRTIKAFLKKFKGESVITPHWVLFMYHSFSSDQLATINWDKWLESPGLPPVIPTLDEEFFIKTRALACRWSISSEDRIKLFTVDDFNSLNPAQLIKFLSCLQIGSLPKWKFEKLTELCSLSTSKNVEIKFKWILIGIKARWHDIIPHAFEFVSTVGRIKFTEPIYSELFKWEEVVDQAKKLFEENILKMHPITVDRIKKLLRNE